MQSRGWSFRDLCLKMSCMLQIVAVITPGDTNTSANSSDTAPDLALIGVPVAAPFPVAPLPPAPAPVMLPPAPLAAAILPPSPTPSSPPPSSSTPSTNPFLPPPTTPGTTVPPATTPAPALAAGLVIQVRQSIWLIASRDTGLHYYHLSRGHAVCMRELKCGVLVMQPPSAASGRRRLIAIPRMLLATPTVSYDVGGAQHVAVNCTIYASARDLAAIQTVLSDSVKGGDFVQALNRTGDAPPSQALLFIPDCTLFGRKYGGGCGFSTSVASDRRVSTGVQDW